MLVNSDTEHTANVLTLDTESSLLSFCLQNGANAGKRFSVDWRCCDNPLCLCKTITLICSPENEVAVASTSPLMFTLDLSVKKMERRPECVVSPGALQLCEDLMAEMDAQDWWLLDRVLHGYKTAMTYEADYTKIDAVFPLDVIIDPTRMVYPKEVLPWSEEFFFEVGEDHWVMQDLYCCNPDCDCRDVMVRFSQLSVNPEGTASVVQRMPDASVDTRTGAIVPEEPPWKGEPKLETLFQALLEDYPEVVEILRERHRDLRLLYKRALIKSIGFTPYSGDYTRAAGPNDPCHCGSGKKFKKCCGRQR